MLLNEQMTIVNRLIRNVKSSSRPSGLDTDINALLNAMLYGEAKIALNANRQYIESACQDYKNQTTVTKLKKLLKII